MAYDFENPERMVDKFKDIDIFINTYYVRFNHGETTFDKAVENTKILIDSAKEAGVKRIVHVSITNPSKNSRYPYFRGKARIEEAIRSSGIPYTILRPPLLFGYDGILINNIAWILRNYPLFMIPGNGEYKVQPVFVEDLADAAILESKKKGNKVLSIIGPETFTYNDLISIIANKVKSSAHIVNINAGVVLLASRILSLFLHDVVLTSDEVNAMKDNLLFVKDGFKARTKFTEWINENSGVVGRKYISELERHFK